ncbi:MAG: galactose mutarotase [Rikenellaceae bacterium]|nr:galactose mutarotase [Rikenellaceae bacterium]
MKKTALWGVLALMLASCSTKPQKQTVTLIPAENFQQVIDGKPVDLYTLTNENGMTVQVTNYGTRIVNLWVPDREGNFRDVVLGRNTLEEYMNSEEKYYGATVGRYANRIEKGRVFLDDQVYQLDINDGENHLHGGSKGYYDVVFDAEPYTTEQGDDAILFTYLSPDGEMGYPGNVTIQIRMVLPHDKNEVQISYKATTDAPTVINLSHHSYFNLSGEGSETILDHTLQINGSHYTPTDEGLIPNGLIATVIDTPLDFTTPRVIGERIDEPYEALQLGGGYDHNWVLDRSGDVTEAAEVSSPLTGIKMTVLTDEPGIQFYSGNFMTGNDIGKTGKSYGFRSAFCLETQNFPAAPNYPEFPSTKLRPGETYNTVCIYRFEVE